MSNECWYVFKKVDFEEIEEQSLYVCHEASAKYDSSDTSHNTIHLRVWQYRGLVGEDWICMHSGWVKMVRMYIFMSVIWKNVHFHEWKW